MKYCTKCGAELVDEAVVCTKCGCIVDPSFQMQQTQKPEKESKAIGILAIVFGALGGIAGLILSIVGICIYKEPANRRNCYIGLGLFIAWIFIFIIYYAVIISTLGTTIPYY